MWRGIEKYIDRCYWKRNWYHIEHCFPTERKRIFVNKRRPKYMAESRAVNTVNCIKKEITAGTILQKYKTILQVYEEYAFFECLKFDCTSVLFADIDPIPYIQWSLWTETRYDIQKTTTRLSPINSFAWIVLHVAHSTSSPHSHGLSTDIVWPRPSSNHVAARLCSRPQPPTDFWSIGYQLIR